MLVQSSEGPCLKKYDEELLKKTPNITLWLPQACTYMCIYEYVVHTHLEHCVTAGKKAQVSRSMLMTPHTALMAQASMFSIFLPFPVHRRHHQLQLHPPGTVSAALHPLTELLRHRPLLPGQLADAEGVARRGHHPHPAPG